MPMGWQRRHQEPPWPWVGHTAVMATAAIREEGEGALPSKVADARWPSSIIAKGSVLGEMARCQSAGEGWCGGAVGSRPQQKPLFFFFKRLTG